MELAIAIPAARQAAIEPQNFEPAICRTSGATPANWVAAARVRRAQQLLETTRLCVEEVALHSGFGSASVLREHFAGIVGTSPVSYRRNFGIA
jgi:transcriptional regulator GlxA family with amidase domain